MWIVGAFLSVLGLSALFGHLGEPPGLQEKIAMSSYQAEMEGELFHAYAQAVFAYAEENPSFNGTVPASSLTALTALPVGTVIPSGWTNTISGNGTTGIVIYVWAPPPATRAATWQQQAAEGMARASGGSMNEGVDVSGVLVPADNYYAATSNNYGTAGTAFSLPVGIPNESLVAVLN